MFNIFKKILLVIYILLLGVSNQLCAHAYRSNDLSKSIKHFICATNTGYNTLKHDQVSDFEPYLTCIEKENSTIDVEENEVEEDETDSSKKHLERLYYSIDDFQNPTLEYLAHYVKKSTSLYIIFRVLRI